MKYIKKFKLNESFKMINDQYVNCYNDLHENVENFSNVEIDDIYSKMNFSKFKISEHPYILIFDNYSLNTKVIINKKIDEYYIVLFAHTDVESFEKDVFDNKDVDYTDYLETRAYLCDQIDGLYESINDIKNRLS